MAHSPSPPPPLHAYWFYTSSIAIDDPLCPLPTTAAQNPRQPPRPFSKYDSSALEAAYKELLQEHRSRSNSCDDKKLLPHHRSPAPDDCVRRRDTLRAREAALEGHPMWNAEYDELEIRDEISSATAPAESSPLERRAAGSRAPSLFAPSSVPSNASTYTAGTETTAVNMTPTRNPFIRSLSVSRNSTAPQQSSANSSRRSSINTKKPPPSPTVPAVPTAQKGIPVGVQRLHQVLLPEFVMTPIYWSPLHDAASVARGTWFYKDTMLPVEAEIANRLETGWEEVRAWTEEWEMELVSAVEVGREGEEKVRWKLWDKASISAPNSRPNSSGMSGQQMLESSVPTSTTKTAPAASNANDAAPRVKPNEWDWVIFANGRDAYICRDSMLTFGQKRPLANIRKGRTVGTHVVRGFSEAEWLKLHPARRRPPPTPPASTASATRNRSASTAATPMPQYVIEKNSRGYSTSRISNPLPITANSEFQAGDDVGGFTQQPGGLSLGENEGERGRVTDLFLVIHGIGQKLSERVESFHFTHYINSFRRLLNVELRNETVRPHLRDNVGLMVLPINWRHNLSFDGIEENYSEGESKSTFNLNDITPPGIPAVRNLIGDVMLDIPYYLSHHKEKMVKAVTLEANRVYRLWCKNNPGFEREGRVHIIAHSLGTALAMDILSKQPTHLYNPNPPPPSSGSGLGKIRNIDVPRDEHFEFNTTNIFFCGSPAAFFLLLNRSMLLPRKGRNKQGNYGADKEPGVAGEAGKYGCMAVDNIYNVLHYSDPIAYRLNPTVDPEYATTLKTAFVPSTTVSFMDAISSTIRSVLPGATAESASPFNIAASQPTMARLPSNIELETHDFSREEMAEKKLFLLNDNGQLDWYLNVSNPLENQYLNMLGAHSSYLASRDFARMLVVEVGRPVGRSGTLRGMRVQKKRGGAFAR